MIVDSIDELEEFNARQFLPICNHGAILVMQKIHQDRTVEDCPRPEVVALPSLAHSASHCAAPSFPTDLYH
jgi:hypothetical protein